MSAYPSPSEVFISEAVKHLTYKQKLIWEYTNYDKLTQDEIAKKMGISQPTVCGHLRAINRSIVKWCKSYKQTYKLLESQVKREEDTIGRDNGLREAYDARHKTPSRETSWKD
jgi:hypothetical protein